MKDSIRLIKKRKKDIRKIYREIEIENYMDIIMTIKNQKIKNNNVNAKDYKDFIKSLHIQYKIVALLL